MKTPLTISKHRVFSAFLFSSSAPHSYLKVSWLHVGLEDGGLLKDDGEAVSSVLHVASCTDNASMLCIYFSVMPYVMQFNIHLLDKAHTL